MDYRIKSISEDFDLTLTYDFEIFYIVGIKFKLLTPYIQPLILWITGNLSKIKPWGNNIEFKRSDKTFTFDLET